MMFSITRSVTRLARPTFSKASSARTFTTFSPLRPTALPSTFRPTSLTPSPTTTSATTADVVPRSAITLHPALPTIRCGPRNTMNRHTRLKQKRRHGFLTRMRSKSGRKILLRRRLKHRKEIAQ